MASGSAIRGTRIGAGPSRPDERIQPAPHREVRYFCANGHATETRFAVDAAAPDSWECPKCGLPAGTDPDNPPAPPQTTPYKSHLAYVKERRSDSDGAALLAEALDRLRQRRGD